MGIHTGEVLVVAGDYVGIEVHRAARVAAAAHGGQVILTDATRVVAGEIGAGIALLDLGEHRLKDFARAERLYQVEADGLETSFPALKTLDLTPNNLPPQLTTFVGRAEVDGAVALLDRTRLLTLTGPGGTGKTRLSLALAGGLRRPVPRRHVVRAARVGDRSGPRAVGDRRVHRAARPAAAAHRSREGPPQGPHRAAGARQLRAGRRGRPDRLRPAAVGAEADGHRVEPGPAARLRRAGVPGPAALAAARGTSPTSDALMASEGGAAVRRARAWRSGPTSR